MIVVPPLWKASSNVPMNWLVNRPGKVGGSVPWKRGWSHGRREVTREAEDASVYA
jgi:hypothetical protein